MESWLVRMVRNRAGRQLAAWALVLGVMGLVAWGQGWYLRDFVTGPHPMDEAALAAVASPEMAPHRYARVSGSQAIDLGLQQITVRTRNGVEVGREVSAEYYALALESRLLLVKSASGQPTTVEGELRALTSELESNLWADEEVRSVRDRFLPYYLDAAESFRFGGWVALGAAAVVLAIFAWKGRPAWRHWRQPEAHPVVARVRGWGDPIGLDVEIERDQSRPLFKSASGWRVGSHYLVQSSFFGFDVLRLEDLLWGYKKVTQHRVNFIPTGKTYAALLRCYGGDAEVTGKEKDADRVLEHAARRTPWAVFGWTADLDKAFAKDAAGFAAAIEQRRRELAKPPSAPA